MVILISVSRQYEKVFIFHIGEKKNRNSYVFCPLSFYIFIFHIFAHAQNNSYFQIAKIFIFIFTFLFSNVKHCSRGTHNLTITLINIISFAFIHASSYSRWSILFNRDNAHRPLQVVYD